MRAPASTTALEKVIRLAAEVRVASSAENSTSSTYRRANCTDLMAISSAFSSVIFSLCERCRGLVAMKVWMRGRLALARALAARSMSPVWQRARAATVTPPNSCPIRSTASKSPSEAMGKPASIASTFSSTSLRAMRIFSGTVMLQPQDCSPSRRVVSKMKTRSLMGVGPFRWHSSESGSFWRIDSFVNIHQHDL